MARYNLEDLNDDLTLEIARANDELRLEDSEWWRGYRAGIEKAAELTAQVEWTGWWKWWRGFVR